MAIALTKDADDNVRIAGFRKEPWELEILPGIMLIIVRDATAFDILLAQVTAEKTLDELKRGVTDMKAIFGAEAFPEGPPDFERVVIADTMIVLLTAAALAERLVIGWRGIKGMEGEDDLPFTPENLRAALRLPQIARAFTVQLLAQVKYWRQDARPVAPQAAQPAAQEQNT